jgi:hypothetical protein
MARQTAAERNAIARAERLARDVNDFKKRVLEQRGRRIYSDAASFAASETGDQTGLRLGGLVWEFEYAVRTLKTELERAQRDATDALERLARGDSASWHSNGPINERDASAAWTKVETLRKAIYAFADATNWRVEQILTSHDRKQIALRDSYTVVDAGSTYGGWLLLHDDGQNVAPICGDDLQPIIYATEQAAWHAFAALVGERF